MLPTYESDHGAGLHNGNPAQSCRFCKIGLQVELIRQNTADLNVTCNGRTYGVWRSDIGRWCVADIDGHVWTVTTKLAALEKVSEIEAAIAAKA